MLLCREQGASVHEGPSRREHTLSWLMALQLGLWQRQPLHLSYLPRARGSLLDVPSGLRRPACPQPACLLAALSRCLAHWPRSAGARGRQHTRQHTLQPALRCILSRSTQNVSALCQGVETGPARRLEISCSFPLQPKYAFQTGSHRALHVSCSAPQTSSERQHKDTVGAGVPINLYAPTKTCLTRQKIPSATELLTDTARPGIRIL